VLDYFKYTKKDNLNIYSVEEIYKVVWSLKSYAIAIYKGLWQDALDAAFFHIMQHYDDSRGDLDHYATRVVGTIMLNKYNHEIEHDISLTTAMDSKSVREEVSTNPIEILLEGYSDISDDFEQCVSFLVPYFIKDFKFFESKRPDLRKLSYTELFQKFSTPVISSAMDYLLKKYGKALRALYDLSKDCKYRKYSSDRYKKGLDTLIEYHGIVNDILIYKSLSKVKVKRSFFYFDIFQTINHIIRLFYSNDRFGCMIEVEGVKVYCSLSGYITTSLDELKSVLEDEIIGSLLGKLSYLRVVVYERGKSIIFSSPKEEDCVLILEMFGIDYRFSFQKIVAKRLLSQEELLSRQERSGVLC
jgi:hypothetical protein